MVLPEARTFAQEAGHSQYEPGLAWLALLAYHGGTAQRGHGVHFPGGADNNIACMRSYWR